MRRDKAARVFADPARVHKVRHAGRYYRVEGYHGGALAAAHAGAVPCRQFRRGQRFAARHAECVFISPPSKEAARQTVKTLREQLVAAGRRPDDVKVFMGTAVVTARTEAEARQKHAEYKDYASREAGLAHFAASTGVDFGRYDLDAPVDYGGGNAIESATRTAQQHGWTRRKLLQLFELGGRYPAIVGDPGRGRRTGVPDRRDGDRWLQPEPHGGAGELCRLRRAGGAGPAGARPLQDRLREGSLRQKLFGAGDRLPARHAAAAFRVPPG